MEIRGNSVLKIVNGYFERELFKDEPVGFVSCDVAQFIKLASGDDVKACLAPLELQEKELVFLAVNDQKNPEEAGGSHWSLLVYTKNLREFHHYDSFGDGNFSAAKKIAIKLSVLLNDGGSTNVVAKETPQQVNCCDCGVYVVCIAEQLTRLFLQIDSRPLHEVVTPQYVTERRDSIRTLIFELAKRTENQE